MQTSSSQVFSLQNFEGPLDLLLQLLSRDEMDARQISVRDILEQFRATLAVVELDVDAASDFIALASKLLLLKGGRLSLNEFEDPSETSEGSSEPLAFIRHLLQYYHLKRCAAILQDKEDQELLAYTRGLEPLDRARLPLKIGSLRLEDLVLAFQTALNRLSSRKLTLVEDDIWTVSEKIDWIMEILQKKPMWSLELILGNCRQRAECIATFLALLELMKRGDIELLDASGLMVQKRT